VKRIAKPTPGPGFNLVISILKHARLLENRGIQLHISWVPGHSDVEGNEHAERLAKEGTILQDDTREAYISLAYLGRMVKTQRFQEWQEQWKTSVIGRSYQGSPTTKFSPLAKELSRHQVATLTQLRTGHGYLTPTSNAFHQQRWPQPFALVEENTKLQNTYSSTVHFTVRNGRKWTGT